jgi:hypothetical protein
MGDKTIGVLNILAALLVLFTAMIDPLISVILSGAFLLGMGIYYFIQSRKGGSA